MTLPISEISITRIFWGEVDFDWAGRTRRSLSIPERIRQPMVPTSRSARRTNSMSILLIRGEMENNSFGCTGLSPVIVICKQYLCHLGLRKAKRNEVSQLEDLVCLEEVKETARQVTNVATPFIPASATTLTSKTCFHEKALFSQDRLGGQKSGTG